MSGFQFRKNNFDLIRLLAALQVVLVHTYHHLDVATGSWFVQKIGIFPGVPIFFVISGFLISASLERSPSLVSYFKNRLLRIYPGLWACFVVSVFVVLCLGGFRGSLADWLPWVAAQLSIGQFYNPDFLRDFGIGVLNGSLWTIPVELQFYLVLPPIYWMLSRINWNRLTLVILFGALVLINIWYIAAREAHESSLVFRLFGVTLLPYLFLFLVGVILQRERRFVQRFLVNRVQYWLLGYILLSVIMEGFGFRISGNYLNPMSAICLAFVTISMGYSYVDCVGNPLRGNDISYGVYIYHALLINVCVHFEMFGDLNYVAFVFGATIVLAFVSWKFVEKPSLALKSYSLRNR